MEPTTSSCSFQPSILFLLLTLLVTSAATAMLCVAFMTDNWEYITWNKEKLACIERNITNRSMGMNVYKLEWLLDSQVARIVLESKNGKNVQDGKSVGEISDSSKKNKNLPALFFAPIRSGIWTFCIILTVEQQQLLLSVGFPQILCTNYLKLNARLQGNVKMDWQHRMQNLSISCALVCLILLSTSALIGAFGVTRHQISAVMITGVMYLLAAIFAAFSLAILYFKRTRSKSDCLNVSTTYGYTIEGVIISTRALEKSYSLTKVNKYFEARIFTTGWSSYLGWGGTALCILVSILWIFLSKIMRFSPINSFLTVL